MIDRTVAPELIRDSSPIGMDIGHRRDSAPHHSSLTPPRERTSLTWLPTDSPNSELPLRLIAEYRTGRSIEGISGCAHVLSSPPMTDWSGMSDEDRLDPAVTTPHPDPDAAPAPEGMAIPILPARDMDETLAFFDLLGFTTETYREGGYGFVRRGGIELQYAANPDVDPFSTAAMAYVRVNNAQALYDEFHAAGLWEPSIRGPELEAEVRRRWASGEPIARTGPPEDKPWGLKEFALLDPCNNLLRFGQPLSP